MIEMMLPVVLPDHGERCVKGDATLQHGFASLLLQQLSCDDTTVARGGDGGETMQFVSSPPAPCNKVQHLPEHEHKERQLDLTHAMAMDVLQGIAPANTKQLSASAIREWLGHCEHSDFNDDAPSVVEDTLDAPVAHTLPTVSAIQVEGPAPHPAHMGDVRLRAIPSQEMAARETDMTLHEHEKTAWPLPQPAGNQEVQTFLPDYVKPPANDGVLPANDEVLPANDEVLPANDGVLPANDEVLPANDEVLPANDEPLRGFHIPRPALIEGFPSVIRPERRVSRVTYETHAEAVDVVQSPRDEQGMEDLAVSLIATPMVRQKVEGSVPETFRAGQHLQGTDAASLTVRTSTVREEVLPQASAVFPETENHELLIPSEPAREAVTWNQDPHDEATHIFTPSQWVSADGDAVRVEWAVSQTPPDGSVDNHSTGISELSYSPSERVIEGAVRGVRVARQSGRETLVVRLHPPELGSISLRLVNTETGLTARFVASEPATRTLLAGQLNVLAESLTQQGLNMEGAGVFSGDASDTPQHHQRPPGAFVASAALLDPEPEEEWVETTRAALDLEV